MLEELRIHDFAIIDELTLSFSPGLVVFTGETGAGKSIILDALGAVFAQARIGQSWKVISAWKEPNVRR